MPKKTKKPESNKKIKWTKKEREKIAKKISDLILHADSFFFVVISEDDKGTVLNGSCEMNKLIVMASLYNIAQKISS